MSNKYTDIENIILQYTAKELGTKKLINKHEKHVVTLFRHMDPNVFKGHKISKFGPIMGKIFKDKLIEIIRNENKDEDFDPKEYQKKMLGSADTELINSDTYSSDTELVKPDNHVAITEFMGINDLRDFKLLFNPESLYVHYYVVLDSNYRDTTEENSTNITKFKWHYAPTQSVGVGFCNSVGVIKDIIGMRMYQPKIPYVSAMNNSAKRVSVLIEEFAPQAFIAQNGRRFHFMLRPNYIDGQTSIEISTEDYNDGIFNFRTPITTLDTLTISFGDPLNVLSFATPFNRFMIPFEFICLKSDK